jgi:hypothetical protein
MKRLVTILMLVASPLLAAPSQKIRWNSIEKISLLTAGSAGVDYVFDTLNLRSAGALLQLKNQGTTYLTLWPSGMLQLGGGGSQGASVGQIQSLTANTSLALYGNRNAADGGADVTINSLATRSAGNLLGINNNGSSKAVFAWDGSLWFSTAPFVTASLSNGSMTIRGNRSGSDSGADVILNGQVNRTAGLLLDVQNNSVSKLTVDFAGNIGAVANIGFVKDMNYNGTSGTWTFRGNSLTSGTALVWNTGISTMLSGKILSLQNNGVEKAYIDFQGGAFVNGLSLTGGQVTSNSATFLGLLGSSADGSSAFGVKIGNTNSLANATAKIVSFYSDNLTTEKAFLYANGILGTQATFAPGRLTVSDTSPTWALGNGGLVEYTTLTAARTVTLPVTSVPTGTLVTIKDGTGNASATLTISVVGVSGNVDGSAGAKVAVATAFGAASFYYNGTQWLSSTPLPKPVEVAMFAPGKWTNSQLLMRTGFATATVVKSGLPNIVTWVGTTATASTVATIFKRTQANAQTSLGTLTWGIGARNATVSFAADVSFAAGDMMEVIGQTTADTTLADTTVNIQAWRQ